MIPKDIPIVDAAFKDDTPVNTVKRIKKILKAYGIETEEKWNESGVPSCFSLRVGVYGTDFGTNGKGVTKEFAFASAYGELMERLQLGKIFREDQQKDDNLGSSDLVDAKVPAKELLEKNRNWYTLLSKKVLAQTGLEVSEENILSRCSDKNGNVSVTSFYCINTQTMEYFPTALLNSVYITNGCAAGNTMEEAIVQAISEIVERNTSMRILTEGISIPEVPEEVLRGYKISYQIISFLRSNGFQVTVKDCSLGTKFPVVCVCLVDRKTGKYHTHFGAYPNLEIALQRTLTETFQGRNIQKVAQFENFVRNNSAASMGNHFNQLVRGSSEKKAEFFVAAAAPYETQSGFAGADNTELLGECIQFLHQQGHDILVRDYSCLGFPTYQVIVPGYSEVFVHRISDQHNDLRHQKYVEKVLRNPAAATIEEIMGFMMNLSQAAKRQLSPAPFSKQANLPAQLNNWEEALFMNATMAYLHYKLGRKEDTAKYLDRMIAGSPEPDQEYLICVKRYLTLSADHYDEETIRKVLEYFHQPQTVQRLYTMISMNENLLSEFVLHCDQNCDSSCLLYEACKKKQTDVLKRLILEKQHQIDQTLLKERLSQFC